MSFVDRVEARLLTGDYTGAEIKAAMRRRNKHNVHRALATLVDRGSVKVVCLRASQEDGSGNPTYVYGHIRNHEQVPRRLQELLQRPWGRITSREDPHAAV